MNPDQPKPATGEWTKEYLTDRWFVGVKTAREIADAHNAALAAAIAAAVKAENKRMMEFWQGEREITERKVAEATKPLVDGLQDIASGIPDRKQMIEVAIAALAEVGNQ